MASKLVLVCNFAVAVEKNRETQFERLLKFCHQILRLFESDRQDRQTFLFEILKKLILGGQLPPTVRSKSFKKSQKNCASFVIGKSHRLSIHLRQ